jgi:hypothetical protein
MDASAKEQRSARVPQIVEADRRQVGALQERRERPLAEVRGVDERPNFRGKHEALILLQVAQALHLLHLAPQVIF